MEQNNEQIRLVTMKELMECLNIKCKSTIYRMINKGMPAYYPNGRARFNVNEVLEWCRVNTKNKDFKTK
jgi:predicted DNA-binding transcriptional regulator AlpA